MPSTARRIRRRYTDVPFATIVAYLGINNLITLLAHPGRQAASLLVSPLDYVWAGMYAAGGALILAGIGARRANMEAAGCLSFAGGALISAVANAAVDLRGTWNTVILLSLLTAAALIRAWHLARGKVLVLVDVAGGPPSLAAR